MTTQYATKYYMNFTGIVSQQSKDMIIEPTAKTPFIKYSEDEEVLMIKGNSTEMDMQHFYYPVISKFKSYMETNRSFKVYFFLKDMNTSTAKVLFDLFKYVNLKKNLGTKVEIAWGTEHSNEEMLQTGKDFAELYGLTFKYISERGS